QVVRRRVCRSTRADPAAALPRHLDAKAAAGEDLRRLPAQRARRDRGGLLLAARARGRPGGDAHFLERAAPAQERARIRPPGSAQAPEEAAQGSLGGDRAGGAGPGALERGRLKAAAGMRDPGCRSHRTRYSHHEQGLRPRSTTQSRVDLAARGRMKEWQEVRTRSAMLHLFQMLAVLATVKVALAVAGA